MKKTILNIVLAALFVSAFSACSKWTELEPNNYKTEHGDQYYENLRAYKATDHPVTFGWFGNWTGKGASLQGSLMGLPDSVDFVSMWGNWHSLNAEKWADKNRVKELKGTKVLMCFIVANVGDQTTPAWVREKHVDPVTKDEYYEVNGVRYTKETHAVNAFWGYTGGYTLVKYPENSKEVEVETDQEMLAVAIRKYAKSLIDTIDKYEWDGYDFDYEANYGADGNIAGRATGDNGNPETNQLRTGFKVFVEEMGKYIGPKSGSGKMFVIDGEPQNMHPDVRDYFDYYIIQAYYCASYTNLDSRYTKLLRGLNATGDPELEKMITKKLIYCEDFERAGYAADGGRTHKTRDGRTVPSLIGMAAWQPISGYEKGGVGSYHMEYDYVNNPEYKWLRKATGIMNPVIK